MAKVTNKKPANKKAKKPKAPPPNTHPDDTPEAVLHMRSLLKRKEPILNIRGFTPEIVQALMALIQAGTPQVTACKLIGVPRSTFDVWRRKGQSDFKSGKLSAQSEFFDALTDAKALAEAGMVQSIVASGVEGKKWLLTRWNPKKYGDRLIIDRAVNDELEQLIDVLEEVLPDELFTMVTDRMKELYPDFKAHDMGDLEDTDDLP